MVAQDLDRSKPIVIVNVDTALAHRFTAKIISKRMFDQLMNVVFRLKIKKLNKYENYNNRICILDF